MAGGRFDETVVDPKTVPGTFINFESGRPEYFKPSERGIVLLPLIGLDYGPERTFIEITNATMSDTLPVLGFDVYSSEPHMLLIREAMREAEKVICYVPRQGKRASANFSASGDGGITVTAKYGGIRGNDFSVACLANPLGGYDIEIFVAGERVEQLLKVADLADLQSRDSLWCTWSGQGELEEIAGVSLSGGTQEKTTNADITRFLDDAEPVTWTTLAFPVDASGMEPEMSAVMQAIESKIKYLRDECGKYRRAVVANYAPNDPSIINVTNGVILSNGTVIDEARVVAWVAGADASANCTTSLTYKAYPNAVDICKPKNEAQATAAIKNGEFFFIRDDEGNVIVQKDINSLTDFSKPYDRSYSNNRVMRTFDTIAEEIMERIKPNVYDNDDEGWDSIDGIGKVILTRYLNIGAIKNVDLETDFLVSREESDYDYAYVDVGIQPVMSIEKFYFRIKTH